jgi:hypothetical protein
MKDILAGCLQMTIASEVGHQYGHSKDDSLQVFEVHGAKYVNVDTTIFEGILKAKSWNLTSSGIFDAIVVFDQQSKSFDCVPKLLVGTLKLKSFFRADYE